jgi:Tfp pilus assembly protein PilN
MINLLPPDIKQNYRYARLNTKLINWVVVASFALVGLAAISIGGIWYLKQAVKPYDSQIVAAEANLKQQDQAGTEKQVKDISDNLKLVIQVLSKEILFSQLLKQLAVIIPSNATLTSFSVNQTVGALDITANTTDYNAATQLQVNLADPANKIFSKADIISINCASDSGGGNGSGSTSGAGSGASDSTKSKYPCTAIIRALFSTDNPFLFIGSTSSTTTKAKATP